jgi:mRNA interferase MazF
MVRGDIYFVDLDPVVGREQSGRRPVVVLSMDWLNQLPLTVTVVPGSASRRAGRNVQTTVRVTPSESGLPQDTYFLCFQVRAIDQSRFQDPSVGRLSPSALHRLQKCVRDCLGL